MNKEDQETKNKLDRLTKSIGPLSTKKEPESMPAKKNGPIFKTSEVIVLLLITTIVSLVMGGTIIYKYLDKERQTIEDKKLQDFIKNYKYITKNYNGQIDEEELLDAALEGMLNKLDKNSVYLDSEDSSNFNTILEGSYDGIGIQIYKENEQIIINAVFENSPAAKAGLKEGDVITKINGKSTKNMTTKQLVEKVKANKNKNIQLTIKRNGKEKNITLSMDTVSLQSVNTKIYNQNNKTIGYIEVSIFASNTYNQFKQKLTKLEEENIDSLIIDLRSNSGGYLSSAENMISLFLDSSHVIYQIEKDKKTTKHYSNGKETKKYKIVLLVDENSASASEVMTSALKEQYGALVIGTKTYGKGTV
ncbi:MAG: S41 family peptidase, partial [Bacilli bacterium]|nr:S41 family peptidase [Bacilli bacterium]